MIVVKPNAVKIFNDFCSSSESGLLSRFSFRPNITFNLPIPMKMSKFFACPLASLMLLTAFATSLSVFANAKTDSRGATVSNSQQDRTPFDFYARGSYRANVPRPQAILGFDVGDFHTTYAQMERAVSSIVTAAPDRMKMYDIGRTNEYRQQHLVIASSPENIARLEQIKANIKRLSDPRGLSNAQAETLVNQTPLVVWLGYTIHGNESASFETMMQVVYHLAASEEPKTQEILRNCLIVINVCANPDGHERFVTWYNSVGVGNADPLAAEHREPWSVNGRFNRFRFDLNRDNIAATQTETRNMQRAYFEWNPQVFVDHHGQPSQYFFPPAATPINPNLPPAQTQKWLTAFGRTNAREFDARQWDYYVRDVFDLFYPGYWDSFPALNGATGMTYETDGGGFKGLRWRREDDTVLTFRSAIAKHYVASLATLETASANARERLKDYYDFKRTATDEGRSETMKRIVLLPGKDPNRAAEIVEIMLRNNIEVSQTTSGFRSTRAHAYTSFNASAQSVNVPAGAYIIDLAQPQKRLAKALLEPNTEVDKAFVGEQMNRLRRNERRGANAPREDYQFYDITAWSLPLAFGVEAYWTEDAANVGATPLQAATVLSDAIANQNITPSSLVSTTQPGNNQPAGNQQTVNQATNNALYNAPLAIESRARRTKLTSPLIASQGGVTGGRASVAYVIPYERNAAASLIYRLLNENYKLAVATRELNAGGRNYPRGTVVVRLGRNPETIHERINQLARETGVEIFAVNSGFNEQGDTGVGSETVVAMRRPRIAVIADEPVSQLSYGAMWWTFDRYGVEWTPITVANLRRSEIDKYNVIIMPDGSPGAYNSAFGASGTTQLRGWVERGGTLVCIKGAAVWAALKDINFTSSRLVGSDDDGTPATGDAAAGGGAAAALSKREQGTAATSNATPNPNQNAATSNNQAANQNNQSNQTSSQDAQTAQSNAASSSSPRSEKMDGAAPFLPPIASPSAKPGRVPEPVPGALMRATVDRTTPLTYGYEDANLNVLIDSAYFFRPSKEGTNAVVFSPDDSAPYRVAGFVWEGNTEKLLRGTAHVIEEPTGRGRVVLYAEDPNYRGIFRTLTKLFFNSFIF